MAKYSEEKLLFHSKHWGLCIGICLTTLGIATATPHSMNTWIRVQKTSKIFDYQYQEIPTHYRYGERFSNSYQVLKALPGRPDLKSLGAGLCIVGSMISCYCAAQLKKDYETLEIREHYLKKYQSSIRQAEFDLDELQLSQNVEVQKWSIELDAQSDISAMLQPAKSYLEEQIEELAEGEKADKYSENATGFLAWVRSKGGTQFEVRKLAQSRSFNGHTVPTETIRKWVDELIPSEVIEWVDAEKKSEFRLLKVD